MYYRLSICIIVYYITYISIYTVYLTIYGITMQSMFVISKVEYFLLASSIPFSLSLSLSL